MARPLRIEYGGALYHLLGRGNRRQAIFESDEDCERFLALLAESLERFEVDLHAFVLMGNHFHLLAQTHRANLSRWMHWLLSTYTIQFQRRHGRVGHGHLFQGRFKSHLVESGSHLLELSRYLHLNPVRGVILGKGELRERRARLRSYRWSSYAGYAGLRAPWEVLSEELILGEMSRSVPGRSAPAQVRKAYRRFVEIGLAEPLADPKEGLVAQTVLGSESFIEQVIDRLQAEQRRASRECTGERRLRGDKKNPRGVEPGRVLQCVEKVYGRPAQEWSSATGRGKWSEERGVAMTLLRRVSDLSYREIGELFGGIDYAAVAQRVRRTIRNDREDRLRYSLKKLQRQCQSV